MNRGAIARNFSLLFLGLLATRLCHIGVLWVEECYPAVAAIQLFDGKSLYRDIWFDKPPLAPFVYMLWGARTGLSLRIAGAVFVLLCCLAIFLFAREVWSPKEGTAAALLLAFFLTFGIPAAVMALAPDLLMILPHIIAVYLAWRGRAFASGLVAGFATLINSKGVFVLAACALWTGRAWPLLLAGFALPNAVAFAWYGRPYFDEVWKWGALYSSYGFSLVNGLVRTLDWAGFQIALLVAAAWCVWHERKWRFVVWLAVSFLAVAAGWRFFPRYFFQLLPALALLAARGYVLLGRKRAIVLALLLIPLIRFGPRYVLLASGHSAEWSDTALNRDAYAASDMIHGGTLLVWGYRPDIFVYTRLPAGTRFLDSQPLTGVIADRHLTSSEPAAPELAAENRSELIRTAPTWIVDGLGPLNPRLAITNYPDLRAWFANYVEAGHTADSVIYRRK